MTLGLTPEHLELAGTVRSWSQRQCPPEVIRSAANSDDHGAARYRELTPGLAELGLLDLHLAETDGGQGFGLPELAVAAEELGHALVPGAFVPTVAWRERVVAMAMARGIGHPTAEPPGGDAEFRDAVRAELAAIGALSGRERTARLAGGGWVLPHLPRPWGRDATPAQQLVIEAEMRSAGLRVPNLAIGAWVAPALIQHGTSEQQERFLPATLRADYLWCQLFSEPGAGSDLAGLSTRAERVTGGWRITGQKIWTSLAMQASWAICLARTDPSAPRHNGISYFLLDMKSEGVQVRPLREITGDTLFNQVFLDGVFVPDDCLVGEVNGGWKIARTTLANERVSLSAAWTFGSGVTELLETARAADKPPLADVGALVCTGQAIDLLALRATLKRLSGTEPGATGSVRKLLGMRHAQQVSELCLAMSGASGALAAAPGAAVGADGMPDGAHWARQSLLTRALTIGGGTTDIQLNIIAERMLGLPRDPDPPERADPPERDGAAGQRPGAAGQRPGAAGQ